MISICTSYYNRREQFIATLNSLKRSSIKDFEVGGFEVIAVDDGSDDNERIDDLPSKFPFLKLYRIDPKDKWYKNPCIPFNLAFSKCSGDKIIIQNPECLHYNDILKLVHDNLTDSNYLTFAVYSIDEKLTKGITALNDKNLPTYQHLLVKEFINNRADINGTIGWYNHGIYRPTGLHFCNAITRKNLKELNGFDERYSWGRCYDDNEFLYRIKLKGLEVKFVDDGITIHQFHPNFNYENPSDKELEFKNYTLFTNVTQKENKIRANEHCIFPQKIVGFAQLRNELSKGNLENWFKQMDVCDYIYIFDQNSDDGSLEYYKKFPKAKVIESPTNRFHEELICKQKLLTQLLHDHPDTDWILWLDGDLLLDGRLLAHNGYVLKDLCGVSTYHGIDACFFNHYNLWRSDNHYRIDDQYHSLDGNWCPLWRNNGHLYFDHTSGLHHKQYPNGFNRATKTSFAVVHRGFATDYQIINKYDTYKSNGQTGWALDRLLNEEGLETKELPKELYPEWFQFTDLNDPKTKKKIKDIYNETQHSHSK